MTWYEILAFIAAWIVGAILHYRIRRWWGRQFGGGHWGR